MKRLFEARYLLLFAVIFASAVVFGALPPPPPGGGPGCWPPPCNPIPIDGGLSYLLLAGVALGGRKLYKMNQKG